MYDCMGALLAEWLKREPGPLTYTSDAAERGILNNASHKSAAEMLPLNGKAASVTATDLTQSAINMASNHLKKTVIMLTRC